MPVNQTFSGPFVPEPYDNSAFVTRLADLINRRADVAAQGALQRGASRAQMWQSAGQAVMQTLAQLAQQRELTKQRAVAAEQQAVENAFKNRQIAVQEAAERNAAARAAADEQWRRDQFRDTRAIKLAENMRPGDVMTPENYARDIQNTSAAPMYAFQAAEAERLPARGISDNMPLAGVRALNPDNEALGGVIGSTMSSDIAARPDRYERLPSWQEQLQAETLGLQKYTARNPVPPNQQRETLLVNGKPTIVNFDPRSGRYTDANTGASVQVSPLPVAPQGPQPSWQWVTRSGEDVYTNRVQPGDTPREMTRVKATEDEKKSAGWFGQMSDALDVINQVEPFLTKDELYQIQSLPQEGLIGLLNRNQLSENAKRYMRAFEQFTEARLRSVSGAAISAGEFEADRRTYAKQYGETEKLANDRRNGRNRALESLQKRAGSALDTPPNKGKSFWDQ